MENHTVFTEHGVRLKAYKELPDATPEAWLVPDGSWLRPQELRNVAKMFENAADFMESAQ